MAHQPSDAMVRLLRVAVAGVGTLVAIGVAGVGLLMVLSLREPGDHGAAQFVAWGVLGAGVAGVLGAGGWTVVSIVDWRRRRDERSPRP